MSGSKPKTKQPVRAYRKSGVFGLKRALKRRGIRAMDGRSVAARAVKEWRRDVEADLGGDLSRQEQTVLDMASCAVFLLGQIDAWIGANPELLIDRKRRSVAPVVRERLTVAAHLTSLLTTLGLKRVARHVGLGTYLARGRDQTPPALASAPSEAAS